MRPGVLYERRHHQAARRVRRGRDALPKFTAIFLIITLASIGLPGLSGFVGEFLLLIGTFSAYASWGRCRGRCRCSRRAKS